MSRADLLDIESRDRGHCGTGMSAARSTLRAYDDRLTSPIINIYVDPVRGSDTAGVGSMTAPFLTITRALREVPHAPIGSSSTFMPAGSYVIHLAPGPYTREAEDDYMVRAREGRAPAGTDPFGAEFQGATDEIPAMGGMPAVPRVPGTTLALDQRKGTRDMPIVIQAAHPSVRPVLNFRLNFRSVQHVHLKNLLIRIPEGMASSTSDAVQFSRIPRDKRAAEGDLPTEHIVIRGCEIDGGGVRPVRPDDDVETVAQPARRSVSGEVVKVNQCQSVFIERCDIYGTAAGNGNCIDFVAVQFGHVVGCDLHGCQTDWAIYTKGGSAFIRVEGNRIHDSAKGFSAGEGTDVASLVPPWWHYEAYAIQFVNNLVYNIEGAGVNVQGGYDILIAHNTLYNVGLGSGTTSSQMISLAHGRRNCQADSLECAAWLDMALAGRQAWATTSHSDAAMVPNRYVYILNNILLMDPSAPSTRLVPGFNVFSIAPDINSRDDGGFEGDRVTVPDPMDPTRMISVLDPARRYPDSTSLPFPLQADRDLRVLGNFVGIVGMTAAIPEATLVDPRYSRSATFYTDFQMGNRNDGQAPALNTTATGDRNEFLVPTPLPGGNVFQTETTSIVSPMPPLIGSWETDLTPLPSMFGGGTTGLPVTPVPPRDSPWMTMHDVYFDLDKVCRESERQPGARVRGPATDNYVRDWTENATLHDDGREPSTHPDFFTYSDVWNQRTSARRPFDAATDQPPNETPQYGAGTSPNNFVFARVSRNSTRGATAGGTAEFLFSEFGVGYPYLSLGTASFSFADGERQTFASLPWRLDADRSPHMCLAVQISTAQDPFVPPTLVGIAPGWPTLDTMVLNDNNKAQRNFFEHPVPMMTTGGGGAGPGGGAGAGDGITDITLYALAHNAATYPRDMQLRCRTVAGAEQASADVGKWLRAATVGIVGQGKAGDRSPFRPGATLTLHDMQPGENRWIGMTVEAPAFKSAALPPLIFEEIVDGGAVNGFAVAARPSPLASVAEGNLANHAGVFSRAAAAFGIEAAARESMRAAALFKSFTGETRRRWWLIRLLILLWRLLTRLLGLGRRPEEEARLSSYARFFGGEQHLLNAAVSELLEDSGGDVFGVREALHALKGAAARRAFTDVALAHASLLNKLDALMTMLQKAQGDPADVLQNVRWQRDLYDRVPGLRETAEGAFQREACETFIRRFTAGEAGEGDFPDFIRASLPSFMETDRSFARGALEAQVKELERSLGSVRAAQKAHREYLLTLQSLAARG